MSHIGIILQTLESLSYSKLLVHWSIHQILRNSISLTGQNEASNRTKHFLIGKNKILINFYLILFFIFFELGSKFHRLPKSCTETLLSLTPGICFQPSNLIPWSSKPRFVIVKTSKPLSIPKTPSQLAAIWVSFRPGSLKIYWVQKWPFSRSCLLYTSDAADE